MKNLLNLAVMGTIGIITASASAQDAIQEGLNAQRNFNAVQTIYRDGVPHVDRQGRTLLKYDPKRSFFPIGSWGVMAEGQDEDGTPFTWDVFKDAGYNTIWPWGEPPGQSAIDAANRTGMQLVIMGEISDSNIGIFKANSDLLLGNVWMDEPIGKFGSVDMDQLFADFNTYRTSVKKEIPSLAVFVNDAPWITPPAQQWWLRWTRSGDLSCHDNYPHIVLRNTPRSIASDPNGIPQSVALATSANEEKRPVWLIAGAFDQFQPHGASFQFRMPSAASLRAQVYAGIIHGATGIHYFIYDSYISRDGNVVGMGPTPRARIANRQGFATPIQQAQSKMLWEYHQQINRELHELTSAILSPTAGAEIAYTVKVTGESVTSAPIRTLLKTTPEGKYILLTVNCDDAVLEVDYAFTGTISNVVQKFDENEDRFSVEGNTIHTVYEPFQVRVIELDVNP